MSDDPNDPWLLLREARAEIERLRAALQDCIHGRRDWMEKAKTALEPKP